MNTSKLAILLVLSVCLNCLTVEHEVEVMNHQLIRKTGIIGKEDGEAFDFHGDPETTIQILSIKFGTVITDVLYQF